MRDKTSDGLATNAIRQFKSSKDVLSAALGETFFFYDKNNTEDDDYRFSADDFHKMVDTLADGIVKRL